MARSFGVACALIAGSLLIGMCGYHFLEELPWIDAFLNAAMILGGMGPVDPMKTRNKAPNAALNQQARGGGLC